MGADSIKMRGEMVHPGVFPFIFGESTPTMTQSLAQAQIPIPIPLGGTMRTHSIDFDRKIAHEFLIGLRYTF